MPRNTNVVIYPLKRLVRWLLLPQGEILIQFERRQRSQHVGLMMTLSTFPFVAPVQNCPFFFRLPFKICIPFKSLTWSPPLPFAFNDVVFALCRSTDEISAEPARPFFWTLGSSIMMEVEMPTVHRHGVSGTGLRFDVLQQYLPRDRIPQHILLLLVLRVLVGESCHGSFRDVRCPHLQQKSHIQPI